MNEDALALFLFQTFMPWVPSIGGFVTAFITIIVLYIMHSWALPTNPESQEK